MSLFGAMAPNLFGRKTDETPNQNQYLSGDPATKTDAQTSWMNPSQPGNSATGNAVQDAQPNPPSQVSNGTMLGSIAAGGNMGMYMPQGYDQGKWNDTNKQSPKYVIGRILSKYPPGKEGLQQARQEIEASGLARITGDDKLTLTDKTGEYANRVIDVGKSFGSNDPSQMAWYWGDTTPDSATMPMGSGQQGIMGNAQQQDPYFLNNLMNQIYQMMQGSKQSQGQLNPMGGSLPMGNALQPQSQMNQQNPLMSILGRNNA